jgi:hypothetical protein
LRPVGQHSPSEFQNAGRLAIHAFALEHAGWTDAVCVRARLPAPCRNRHRRLKSVKGTSRYVIYPRRHQVAPAPTVSDPQQDPMVRQHRSCHALGAVRVRRGAQAGSRAPAALAPARRHRLLFTLASTGRLQSAGRAAPTCHNGCQTQSDLSSAHDADTGDFLKEVVRVHSR